MNKKKIISLILCAVLFIGVLPISAFAVTGMGIDVDTPYAGKGTVRISWNKVSKADGYQFSLRYLENNDLIFDHEDADGPYVEITRNWEAGTYRFWAGAYRLSAGENPENSYTWAYQEEYVFTIEECCSHGHIETAWDTSKTISYKSISEKNHEITGYQYKYCTDCFARVGSSFKVTETEAHQFNKNGDCILCDYTSGCEHPDTILTIIDGYPSYTPYNEYQHKYTIHYDKLCKDCFETVSKNVSAETGYEAHDFDNNGICRECKYIKPAEQTPLTVTVSSDRINSETGETISATASASGGSGSYKFAWKISKNDITVYETDLNYGSNYSNTFDEEGTYTVTVIVKDKNEEKASANCTITVKSKLCKHSKTKYELSDTEYTSYNSEYHKVNKNYNEVCIDCRKTVNSKVESSYEEHTFDGKGICTKCGCVRTSDNKDSGNDNTTTSNSECKHSVKREKISSSLKQMSGDKKEHYVVSQYREYCDCGYIDRTFEETSKEACVLTSQRIEAEHHAGLGHKLFRTCKSCGYAYYEGYSTLSSCEFCNPKEETPQHEYDDCCECVGHALKTTSIYGGYLIQECSRCGYTVKEKTNGTEALLNYANTVSETKKIAEEYKKTIGEKGESLYSSSVWKNIADQATQKLCSKGFVGFCCVADIFANPVANIINSEKGITSDEFYEQQKVIWEQIILNVLTENSESSSSKNNDTVLDVTQLGLDVVDMYSYSVVKNTINCIKSLIKEVDDSIKYFDFTEKNLFDYNGLLKTRDSLCNLLDEVEAKEKKLSVSDALGYAIIGAKVFYAANEKLAEISQLERNYQSLIQDYEYNLNSLNDIIQTADGIGNKCLSDAASEVKDLMNSNFTEECNSFIEILSAAGKELTLDLIEYEISDVTTKLLPGLGVVSIAASLEKLATNFDDVFEEAELLMAMSVMSASMDIARATAVNADSDLYFQLWLNLQMCGVDQAKNFLNSYTKKIGASLSELGLDKNSRYYAIYLLNAENGYYIGLENDIQ